MLVILFSPTCNHIDYIENHIDVLVEDKKLLVLDTKAKKNNFLRLIYAHESWWDEFRLPHLRKRFVNHQVIIYDLNIIEDTPQSRRLFKDHLRSNISIKVSASRHIHIADSLKEDQWIISLINSDYLYLWLELSNIIGNAKCNMLLKEWKCELNNNPSSEHFVLGGSLALYLFGLLSRYPRDVDYIFTSSELLKPIPNWNLNCHNEHLRKYIGADWASSLLDHSKLSYKDLVICHPKYLLKLKLKRCIQTKLYKDLRDLFYMDLRLNNKVLATFNILNNHNLLLEVKIYMFQNLKY